MAECVGCYPRCEIEVRSVCENDACFGMSSTILASPVDTRLTPIMSREDYRRTMRRLEQRSENTKERRRHKR